MFEFHAYDRRSHAQLPAELCPQGGLPPPAGDVVAASFLFWSEHCVECAAPACYASCALYRSRADGRCRRFAFGLFRNTRFDGMRGYGAELAFGRWGKLKANGNTWMEPLGAVIRKERLLDLTTPLRRILGRIGGALGHPNVWSDPSRDLDRRARRLHRRVGQEAGDRGRRAALRPDAFLIEVYNPEPAPVSMELEMRIAADLVDAAAARRAPPFRAVVHLEPGHGRRIIPRAAFAAVSESGLPFKLSFAPIGEATPRLVVLALDFVTWRPPPAATAGPSLVVAEPPAIKCVVFDLDNTLWRGTLLEAGGTEVAPPTRRVLESLDRRGILLAIASKNDRGPALDRLRDFGLDGMFVATKIDWRAKSQGIAEIAAELNLGLDTFAFVDDSAFERAEVAAALPSVACFDAADLTALPDHPRLRGGASDVSRDRRRLYREAAARAAVKRRFAGDEDAFLRACRLRLEIAPCRPEDSARVVELVQRTNQLNASGTKHGEDACAAFLAEPMLEKFVLRCGDVHGDYGLVGFALVRIDEEPRPTGSGRARRIRIEEFVLSCRMQGRRLERAFFHYLATSERGSAAASLWINFRPSGRNGPLGQVLDDLMFSPCAGGGYALDLPAAHLACDLVEVVDVARSGGGAAEAPARPAVA
ncbi:MAG: HAD-IIIC family phosphatase [Rhodospirillales bacterium]|nr:HAD-IIIC family phosphatase [Rhodospirillales bacterium]